MYGIFSPYAWRIRLTKPSEYATIRVMQTLENILSPLRGLTDGQLRPHAEACGLSVHTVRNALTKTKSPRYATVLKLIEVSQRVSSHSASPAGSSPR
jgi:hypothetical protein